MGVRSTAAQLEALLPTEDELEMLRSHPTGSDDRVDELRLARLQQVREAIARGLSRDELELLLGVWRGALSSPRKTSSQE